MINNSLNIFLATLLMVPPTLVLELEQPVHHRIIGLVLLVTLVVLVLELQKLSSILGLITEKS